MNKFMECIHHFTNNELPSSFTKEIHDLQRNYSVTMLMHDDEDINVIPCSGTLAQIGRHKGIITARHVWDEAKKHEFLLTLIGQGNYAFETKYLEPVIPATIGKLHEFKVDVPDIAFIKLPAHYVSNLEASGKVFFNIDKRITDKSYHVDIKQGYWTIFGNLNERLEIDKKKVSSFVYGTGISRQFDEDGWDYYIIDLDIEENSDIPKDYSGMSGGGIWRAKFHCDEMKEKFEIDNIIFMGVNFFQTSINRRKLIGHGSKSIYELLYQHVINTA